MQPSARDPNVVRQAVVDLLDRAGHVQLQPADVVAVLRGQPGASPFAPLAPKLRQFTSDRAWGSLPAVAPAAIQATISALLQDPASGVALQRTAGLQRRSSQAAQHADLSTARDLTAAGIVTSGIAVAPASAALPEPARVAQCALDRAASRFGQLAAPVVAALAPSRPSGAHDTRPASSAAPAPSQLDWPPTSQAQHDSAVRDMMLAADGICDPSPEAQQARLAARCHAREGILPQVPAGAVPASGLSPVTAEQLASLSQDQRVAYASAVQVGSNTFICGPAGTGKSHVLGLIVQAFKYRYAAQPNAVVVTAGTGVAACNVGGVTLHSFLKLPPHATMQQVREHVLPRLLADVPVHQMWQDVRLLIIDEVSLVDSELLNMANLMAQTMRNSSQPFGGVQVLFTGDFAQLPPVKLGQPLEMGPGTVQYAWQSSAWKTMVQDVVMLRKIFRQRGDAAFAALLRRVRDATCQPADYRKLAQGGSEVDASAAQGTQDCIQPTYLYSTNARVQNHNSRELRRLAADTEHEYIAHDSGEARYIAQLRKSCNAEGRILLRKGAQVMLLRNLDVIAGLVNGARGVIVDFRWNHSDQSRHVGGQHSDEFPVVKFLGGAEHVIEPAEYKLEQGSETLASRWQVPLRLAWGITVHKSQGMTISLLQIDLGRMFAPGMAYVALSRGVALSRVKILNLSPHSIKADKTITKFHECVQSMMVVTDIAAAAMVRSGTPLAASLAQRPEPIPALPEEDEEHAPDSSSPEPPEPAPSCSLGLPVSQSDEPRQAEPALPVPRRRARRIEMRPSHIHHAGEELPRPGVVRPRAASADGGVASPDDAVYDLVTDEDADPQHTRWFDESTAPNESEDSDDDVCMAE